MSPYTFLMLVLKMVYKGREMTGKTSWFPRPGGQLLQPSFMRLSEPSCTCLWPDQFGGCLVPPLPPNGPWRREVRSGSQPPSLITRPPPARAALLLHPACGAGEALIRSHHTKAEKRAILECAGILGMCESSRCLLPQPILGMKYHISALG